MNRVFFSFLMMISTLSNAADKFLCESQELLEKKCSLRSDNIQINLKGENIVLFVGSKIKIYPTPFHSSLSEWENVRFEHINSTNILIITSWDMPGGGDQNLMQAIYKVSDGKLDTISTKTIQTKSWKSENSNFIFSPRLDAHVSVDSQGKVSVKY
jgi:hypothetical protein